MKNLAQKEISKLIRRKMNKNRNKKRPYQLIRLIVLILIKKSPHWKTFNKN